MVIKETNNEKVKKSSENNENISVSENINEETCRVGDLLHHERQKKGLDLETVSQVLCIRKVYLEAIENGNYVELPSLPYSAGFVNSYAKYLGLNNVRITQLFREELDAKPVDKKVFLPEDMAAEASLPSKKYVIGGLIALALIACVWALCSGEDQNEQNIDNNTLADEMSIGEIEYFSPMQENQYIQQGSETQNEAPTEVVNISETTDKNSLIEPQKSDVIEQNNEASLNEQKVKIPAKFVIKIKQEETWIEVRDANKIYFNKIMKPGESYVVPEGKGMILSAGKYHSVEVYVNDQLTPVVKPNKKMNIPLDPFAETNE